MRARLAILVCVAGLVAIDAPAACVNKFTRRVDGSRHIVTFLTGKLTFQTAQALAAAIREGKASPIEWVDGSGKSIARQFGDLKVVRPMPVACDGNASGVIMIAVFPGAQPPGRRMFVKLDPKNVITFDEQSD
ncbi:MAG: hypothetical protein NVSMB68_04560 [Thermoanaerobaculia bacterium]